MKIIRSKKKLSRRDFLVRTAVTTGALMATGILGAESAQAHAEAGRTKLMRKKALRRKA